MSFKLTDEGVRAAEKIEDPRDADTETLAFMYSVGKNSTVEVQEIQDRVKMGTEKTIRVLERLKNTGYIEEV